MSSDSPDCAPWFGSEPVTISRLDGSGFSGSRVFLVRRASGTLFVLKNFPDLMLAPQAAWVHRLMQHLRAAGVDAVPGVVARQPGALGAGGEGCPTLAVDPLGVRWELVEWIPGSPRRAPTDAEAAAALGGLARLHVAAATLPGSPPRREPSPGIDRRIDHAQRMVAAPWHRLAQVTAASVHEAVFTRLIRALEIFDGGGGRAAVEGLASHEASPVVCQPVLRDLWSDHVLFTDDGRLAGFVDYHAAGYDTPATDIARLLGSWDAPALQGRETLADRWRGSIEAYEAVRPLSLSERSLIPWLHATGVLCGLDNWFRWLITDRRQFDDMNRVLVRLDRLLEALPDALAGIRIGVSSRN